MHKKKDYRTFNDKIYDFMYKHRIKIIVLSFVYSLCVFVISLITFNEGGLHIIVLYPLALIVFIHDLIVKYSFYKYIMFSFPILAMIASMILFVLGFFISI